MTDCHIFYVDNSHSEKAASYAAYQQYYEDARMDLFAQAGFTMDLLTRNHNVRFLVNRLESNAIATILPTPPLEIRTSVSEIKGATIVLRQESRKPGEATPIMELSISLACVDAVSLCSAFIPLALREPLKARML